MSQTSALWSSMSSRTLSRLLSVPVAGGTGTILGVAMWLTPSPTGHGTHLQLGLGQCTFLAMTGYPCPMCGMTTTFTLLAHIHPITAMFTQPFGLVLFSMTVGALSTSQISRARSAFAPENRAMATSTDSC